MKETKDNNETQDNKMEELAKQIRRNRIVEIGLIIIIILLILLFYLLGWKLWKIGYNTEQTSVVISEDDSDDEDEEMDIIIVTEDDVDWNKKEELNIFNNVKFNGEKKIAPWSSGTYKFCVKNEVGSDITYDISFSDAMTNPVNMVYKLKIDNVYVRGDSENYVSIDELDLDDVIVKKDSNNVYTLEWYWADDDEADTYTGSQQTDQYYTLNLNIQATLYNE